MQASDLNNIFTYHRPSSDQAKRYERLRAEAKVFAQSVNELCPESREKSLAITSIQESVMWANASIALHEK